MAAHNSVKLDPAIERWNLMREDTYKNFKWTTRTTRFGIVSLIVIPGLVYYMCARTDLKYDWTARRKGENLTVRN